MNVVSILRAGWRWSDAHAAERLVGYGCEAIVGSSERGWFWHFQAAGMPVGFTEAALSIDHAKSRAEAAMLEYQCARKRRRK